MVGIQFTSIIWYRIRNLHENILISKAYQSQLSRNIQSDCLNTVYFLLKYLEIENSVDDLDSVSFEKEGTKRLLHQFISEWKTKLKGEVRDKYKLAVSDRTSKMMDICKKKVGQNFHYFMSYIN